MGGIKTVWPSGLRRWLKAPVRKGVGSILTAVTYFVVTAECDGDQIRVLYRMVATGAGDPSDVFEVLLTASDAMC